MQSLEVAECLRALVSARSSGVLRVLKQDVWGSAFSLVDDMHLGDCL